jgi:hypothetical protein
MNFTHSYQAESDWRDYARRRYRNRALLCSLPRATDGDPQPLLAAEGFNLSSSRPVQPGRGLLLKLRGADEGSTQTLLARVASADRRADGSWLVHCRFAGTPAS